VLVAELLDLDGARQIVNERFAAKQPDWSFDDRDSGQTPAERLTDHRA
jgi:hypothetical protein